MQQQEHSGQLTKHEQQSKSFTFIVSSTEPQSRRSFEVHLAEAKSHAARETHRKRALLRKQRKIASTGNGYFNALSTLTVSKISGGSQCHIVNCHHQVHPTIAYGATQSPSPFPGFGCFREELVTLFPPDDQPHVSHLVDFWSHMLNPGIYLFTEVFNICDPHPLFLSLMSNRTFYHAGFSVVWLALLRQFVPTPTSSRLVDSHRALAVTRIREQLESRQNSPGIAAAIVWLALLDFSLGARDKGLLHLKGLSAYLTQIGGIDKLSEDEGVFISHFGSSLALLSSSSWFARPARSRTRCNTSYDVSLIPRGFRALVGEQAVWPDAIGILVRAAQLNMDLDSVAQDNERRAGRHKMRRYHDCVEACPILVAPDSEQSIISKMICFSMLLYCHLNIPTRAPCGWGKASHVYLTSKVEQRDPSTIAERNFFVWVSMLLIHSYWGRGFFTSIPDEVKGPLRKLHQYLRTYESKQWFGVEEVLKDFFWPSQLSKKWEHLWSQLTESTAIM